MGRRGYKKDGPQVDEESCGSCLWHIRYIYIQMYLVIDGVDDGLGHSGWGRMWEIRIGEKKGSPVVATCL